MRDIRIYKDFVLCTGLMPIIVGMVLCAFFPDTIILYICSIIALARCAFQFFRPDRLEFNTLSLHAAFSLTALAVAKTIGGNGWLPEDSVPITLEILMLCLSLLYLLTASYYSRFLGKFGFNVGINNYWATLSVIAPTFIHLFLLGIIYAVFESLSDNWAHFLVCFTPPLAYIAAIRMNFSAMNRCMKDVGTTPIIRVAAVCNGKVYVTPASNEKDYMDFPIQEVCLAPHTTIEHTIRHIQEKYQPHLKEKADLRFSLKYLFDTPFGTSVTVLLYVLPLKDESDIHFEDGRFVSPAEITEDTDKRFSLFLKKEAEHLEMVVEMWKTYQ